MRWMGKTSAKTDSQNGQPDEIEEAVHDLFRQVRIDGYRKEAEEMTAQVLADELTSSDTPDPEVTPTSTTDDDDDTGSIIGDGDDMVVMVPVTLVSDLTVHGDRPRLEWNVHQTDFAHAGAHRVPAQLMRALETARNELVRAEDILLDYLESTGQPIPWGFPGYRYPAVDMVEMHGEPYPTIVDGRNELKAWCPDCDRRASKGESIIHSIDCTRRAGTEPHDPIEGVVIDANESPRTLGDEVRGALRAAGVDPDNATDVAALAVSMAAYAGMSAGNQPDALDGTPTPAIMPPVKPDHPPVVPPPVTRPKRRPSPHNAEPTSH